MDAWQSISIPFLGPWPFSCIKYLHMCTFLHQTFCRDRNLLVTLTLLPLFWAIHCSGEWSVINWIYLLKGNTTMTLVPTLWPDILFLLLSSSSYQEVSFRLIYTNGFSSPLIYWDRTAPRPTSAVSLQEVLVWRERLTLVPYGTPLRSRKLFLFITFHHGGRAPFGEISKWNCYRSKDL